MAFDNSGTNAVWAARLGITPKWCDLPVFLAAIGQAVRPSRALDLESPNMEFQQDWPRDKKIQLFSVFAWKLRKISLDRALSCASRGIENFLYRISTGRTSLESCRLAELKYAFFSRTGSKTKRLQRSKLFLSMVFKHGLLEGSTILLQYSAITCTSLESSWLGELKYAISAG